MRRSRECIHELSWFSERYDITINRKFYNIFIVHYMLVCFKQLPGWMDVDKEEPLCLCSESESHDPAKFANYVTVLCAEGKAGAPGCTTRLISSSAV